MSRFVASGSGTVLAGLFVCSIGLAPCAARAVVLPVEVEFALRITLNGLPYPGVATTGSGTAIVNGSGAGGHLASLALPASLFATAGLTTSTTAPTVFPVVGLYLDVANGAGSVAETVGGKIGGAIPLGGVMRFCLFLPCGSAVANLSVPLSPIGVGGSAFVAAAVNVTVQGAPWTTGTAMRTHSPFTETITGFAHGPASGTSSTAQAGGVLQLVTPIAFTTDVAPANNLLAFGILTIRFVPEPGTALLLAGGIVALGTMGRRK
jgi:hypothetical protein